MNFVDGPLQGGQKILDPLDTLLEAFTGTKCPEEAALASSRFEVSPVLDLALDGAGLISLRAPVPPDVAGDLLHEDLFERPDRLIIVAQTSEQLPERFWILPELADGDQPFLGEEAVLHRVHLGPRLPFGGRGPRRLLCVPTIGRSLPFTDGLLLGPGGPLPLLWIHRCLRSMAS